MPGIGHSLVRSKTYAGGLHAVVQAQPSASLAAVDKPVGRVDVREEDGATVISVTAEDQGGLLMGLTGLFNTMDLTVLSASIKSLDDGSVSDEFRVQLNGGLVPGKMIEELKDGIENLILPSSQSSMPAIYGMAAAAEVRRLQPVSGQTTSQAKFVASALELAAAEMAQQAAVLVNLERQIVALAAEAGNEGLLETKEVERQEAAALLERKMAAMEASLASRRAPIRTSLEPASPDAARGPGGDLRFAGGGATSTGPASGNNKGIILQGFNWESSKEDWYVKITKQAAGFAEVGYTAVWMPPPSDAVSPEGYLPRDLYDLNSGFGSESELRDCIAVLKENNLTVVADIVINHRCAHYQDDSGKWNTFGGRLAWDKSAVCSNNRDFAGTGANKTGEDYTAAPNIDHTNPKIQADLIEWLQHLKKVGFDGWRFDYTKGYHGRFCQQYVNASVPEMAFGEFWDTCSYTDGVLNYNQDTHRQRTVDWIDQTGGTCSAFDFTTKGILQEACGRSEYWRLVDGQGRPPGLLGLWPSRSITFIENHDTGSTLNHWPFPWQHLHQGYAYILTHPGTPCVFYDHHFQEKGGLGNSIRELVAVRIKSGVNCRSKVKINHATADLYAATIDDKLAMKIGHGDWSPSREGGTWKLNCSGPQFAVWLRTG